MDAARAYLERLGARRTGEALPAADVAVVVAHPDDETIGIGGHLPALAGVTLVVVTDGAPVRLDDARRHGLATRAAYAEVRRHELRTALAQAGVGEEAIVAFHIPDQEAARHLPATSRRLAELLCERAIRIVFTHPFEGGHPDHDAVAFAVHAARALVARRGGEPPGIAEMAFYHAGPAGMVAQRFLDHPDCPEIPIELAPEALACKRRMIAAHVTQQATLAPFGSAVERFRPAPPYDFRSLPNQGRLYYSGFDWGVTGEEWRTLACVALDDLGL